MGLERRGTLPYNADEHHALLTIHTTKHAILEGRTLPVSQWYNCFVDDGWFIKFQYFTIMIVISPWSVVVGSGVVLKASAVTKWLPAPGLPTRNRKVLAIVLTEFFNTGQQMAALTQQHQSMAILLTIIELSIGVTRGRQREQAPPRTFGLHDRSIERNS